MKVFPAKAQSRTERLRFFFAPLRLCAQKFVVTAIALSFFATLVPIAGASSATMPCCVGKAAGHCESGIPAMKVPPPPPEPMCGLDNSEFEDDRNTIVAEPSHNDPHDSFSQTAERTSHAAETNSLEKPCQMECGACAASSSRQQRRERSIAQAATSNNPLLSIHSRFGNQPFSFSSNEDWEQTSPRGPPADLL